MSEELYIPHTARNGLFAVYFEVEFLLYEVRDAFFDALGRSWSLAEDYAVICVAYKRMSALLQLFVKFVENYITKERAGHRADKKSLLLPVKQCSGTHTGLQDKHEELGLHISSR